MDFISSIFYHIFDLTDSNDRRKVIIQLFKKWKTFARVMKLLRIVRDELNRMKSKQFRAEDDGRGG